MIEHETHWVISVLNFNEIMESVTAESVLYQITHLFLEDFGEEMNEKVLTHKRKSVTVIILEGIFFFFCNN